MEQVCICIMYQVSRVSEMLLECGSCILRRIDDVKVLSLTQGLGPPYIYAYSLLSGSWKVTDILHTEGHSSNLTPYTILELSWGTDCM